MVVAVGVVVVAVGVVVVAVGVVVVAVGVVIVAAGVFMGEQSVLVMPDRVRLEILLPEQVARLMVTMRMAVLALRTIVIRII